MAGGLFNIERREPRKMTSGQRGVKLAVSKRGRAKVSISVISVIRGLQSR